MLLGRSDFPFLEALRHCGLGLKRLQALEFRPPFNLNVLAIPLTGRMHQQRLELVPLAPHRLQELRPQPVERRPVPPARSTKLLYLKVKLFEPLEVGLFGAGCVPESTLKG
jgi:hypothetical protein